MERLKLYHGSLCWVSVERIPRRLPSPETPSLTQSSEMERISPLGVSSDKEKDKNEETRRKRRGKVRGEAEKG